VAAFGAASAWMQMNRLLNLGLAAILAGVFIVIELIFVLRARQETRHD
jgi:formate/nitrite transporter FocA (FNT family)